MHFSELLHKVTVNVFHTSSILFTLMMEAILSSETSFAARAKRRHIPEYGISLFNLPVLVLLTTRHPSIHKS
jgi:hypothetical protein